MAVSREEILQSLIDTLELCSAKVKGNRSVCRDLGKQHASEREDTCV